MTIAYISLQRQIFYLLLFIIEHKMRVSDWIINLAKLRKGMQKSEPKYSIAVIFHGNAYLYRCLKKVWTDSNITACYNFGRVWTMNIINAYQYSSRKVDCSCHKFQKKGNTTYINDTFLYWHSTLWANVWNLFKILSCIITLEDSLFWRKLALQGNIWSGWK